MSRLADQRTLAVDAACGLDAIYAPVQRELAEVEDVLEHQLQSDDPAVDELVRYGVRLGGKRLRPALLLLSGSACGTLNQSHVVLAAVAEMIHTATLIHDDVLDEAAIRRHVDTVNARWNNEKSVLLGDFLFTHAFYLASTTESTYACRTIGRATNIVCEGELRQTNSSGDLELTEKEYLSIIQAKTAELCACCCRLGAHFAGAELAIEEALCQFGRNLGIAFQIADDLLDLVGDEATTGKSLGTDLAKCKITLPFIHLRDRIPPALHQRLAARLAGRTNGHDQWLFDQLHNAGSLDYARQRAEQFAVAAAESLTPLPESPSRDVLMQLTEFVVARRR